MKVSKLAEAFKQATEPNDFASQLMKSPRQFCTDLNIPSYIISRLELQLVLLQVEFYWFINFVLEEYVKRNLTNATYGGVLEALRKQKELNALRISLQEQLELPEDTLISVDIGEESRKDFVHRYVPICFQVPDDPEMSSTFEPDLKIDADNAAGSSGWTSGQTMVEMWEDGSGSIRRTRGREEVGTVLPRPTLIRRIEEITQLSEMHASFREGRSQDAVALVTGQEGVGKATLVSEYCRLVHDPYKTSIIWLHYGNEFDMARQVIELQSELGLAIAEDELKNQESTVLLSGLRNVFLSHKEVPILLVLEDVAVSSRSEPGENEAGPNWHLLFKILRLLNAFPPPKVFLILTCTSPVYTRREYVLAGQNTTKGHFADVKRILQPSKSVVNVRKFRRDDAEINKYWRNATGNTSGPPPLFGEGGWYPLELRVLCGLFLAGHTRDVTFKDRDGDSVDGGGAENMKLMVRKCIRSFFQSNPECGHLFLFIITFLFPTKRFPYEIFLNVFKCVWAARVSGADYKIVEPNICYRCLHISNSDDEYELFTDEDDGPANGNPEKRKEKLRRKIVQALTKGVLDTWDTMEVTTIVETTFKSLETLGLSRLHKTVGTPNHYNLPKECFGHSIELHPKVRDALMIILSEDGHYHETCTEQLEKVCHEFDEFSDKTRNYMLGHAEEITKDCAPFRNAKLPKLLGTDAVLRKYAEMDHDYAVRLRELCFACFLFALNGAVAVFFGVLCLNNKTDKCYDPSIAATVVGGLGIIVGYVLWKVTYRGRLHPPTPLGKVIRGWESNLKPACRWVTAFVTLVDLGILVNLGFVNTTGLIIGIVIAVLVVITFWVLRPRERPPTRKTKRIRRKIRVQRELLPRMFRGGGGALDLVGGIMNNMTRQYNKGKDETTK